MEEKDIKAISRNFQKRIKLTILFDLYSPLLTGKQREIFEMHEILDLSLSEISEKLGTSRQSIHDILNRTFEKIERIEQELGFSRVMEEQREFLLKIEELVNEYSNNLPEEFLVELKNILFSAKGDL